MGVVSAKTYGWGLCLSSVCLDRTAHLTADEGDLGILGAFIGVARVLDGRRDGVSGTFRWRVTQVLRPQWWIDRCGIWGDRLPDAAIDVIILASAIGDPLEA